MKKFENDLNLVIHSHMQLKPKIIFKEDFPWAHFMEYFSNKLSVIKNVCNPKVLREIEKIYYENNLGYTIKRFSSRNKIKTIIPYLKNDKKNNDNKINFILLKNIGKTTLPNKFKMSLENVRKLSNSISQY